MARIAAALGATEAAGGLFDLAASLGAKTALRDIGMHEADLDMAAELACRNPYYNPRPVEPAAIRALLEAAYHGRRPGS
jgi:alcohol dehydrogenase class IV